MLFDSGSENIQDQYFPVLARVGQALESAQGQIVVTGYTDDTPIQSMSFPSNWHLSQARADAIKQILLKYVTKKTVFVQRVGEIPTLCYLIPALRTKRKTAVSRLPYLPQAKALKLGTSVERTVAVQP